ncbi:MAG: hypothetical protein LUH05_08685 [Candidatus Gastranaerophilales bacterium]|nr:hypothetical protein [Candidatus Gastranaerophilales bacterium]
MPEYLNLYNVFAAVSIFSTVFYVIKLAIFMLTGADAEVDAQFDTITETEVSFNFLSVQSILAFFMGFGWSGLAAVTQFELDGKIALAIAILVGSAFMFLSAYLMFGVKKLNKNIKVNLNELEGKTGKAYTSINAKSEGQIEIVLNNKLTILNAINISDEKIEAFSQVKVIKVEDDEIHIIKE